MLVGMDLSLARIEERLAAHPAKQTSRLLAPKRAAVAAVLRYRQESPEVLLMHRSARKGDRWSGHVSFPGGREEESDADLIATATRETREEVGIDLEAGARLIGRSDSIRAVAKGKFLPMSITPFIFVQTEEMELELNHEAQSAFWLPLAPAAKGVLDDSYPYKKGPVSWTLPCWRYDGHLVWGLTYQMLTRLLEVIRS